MAKLRKGVKRVSKKTPRKSRSKRISQSRQEAIERDAVLFSSAWKAYLISAVLLLLGIWINGRFPPFLEIFEFNEILGQVIGGGVGVLFFFFLVVSWGNALEVKGNIVEWKHIIISIIITIMISAWGGGFSFIIVILGAFAILTYFWYLQR